MNPSADEVETRRRDLVALIRNRLDALAGAEEYSGVVLLARGGEVLLSEARGLACRSFRVPCTVDTRFNLGSMNKMFTAVALARLVERGTLVWTGRVCEYLSADWFAPQSAEITLAQLATHTSGLGDYFSPEFLAASRERFRSVDDYRPLVADQKPQFPPGTAWRYSNAGYLLLGAILERVCGQPIGDCLRTLVFEPAGMPHTGCFDVDGDAPLLALGYSRVACEAADARSAADPHGTHASGATHMWRSNLFAHVVRGGPAGGGFSTASDLLRFDAALRGGSLVTDATRELLWTPTAQSIAAGKPYGMGFRIRASGGSGAPVANPAGVSPEPARVSGRVVGHNGTFAGLSTVLAMHLDSGWTIVILSNIDSGAAGLLGWIETLLHYG